MAEPINGLYGSLYDEDGREVQATQEFEATLEFNKSTFFIAGDPMEKSKVTGMRATFTLNLLHVDTRLQRKIAENPNAKYSYIGKLNDPTVDGQEAVLMTGMSFDGTKLIGWNVQETGTLEFNGTFEGYRFLDSIE